MRPDTGVRRGLVSLQARSQPQNSVIFRAARLEDGFATIGISTAVEGSIQVRLALAAINDNGVSNASHAPARRYDLLPVRVGTR